MIVDTCMDDLFQFYTFHIYSGGFFEWLITFLDHNKDCDDLEHSIFIF